MNGSPIVLITGAAGGIGGRFDAVHHTVPRRSVAASADPPWVKSAVPEGHSLVVPITGATPSMFDKVLRISSAHCCSSILGSDSAPEPSAPAIADAPTPLDSHVARPDHRRERKVRCRVFCDLRFLSPRSLLSAPAISG